MRTPGLRDRAMGVLFVLSGVFFVAGVLLRTRALPRWTGYVFLIATALLLGQYAAFRGALPFPQFLAFIAIGIAALVRCPALGDRL
jgi:hypothetical protein